MPDTNAQADAASPDRPYNATLPRSEMAGNPLEDYLGRLRDIRRTGSAVPETSYYSALVAMLDAVGATLKPVFQTAGSKQIAKYLKDNRQILVTNYRDFLLAGADPEGRPVQLEYCRRAPDEAAFWTAANYPRALAAERGEGFVDFLKRVMLHAAPVATPKDLAWFMASYAREALRMAAGRGRAPRELTPTPVRARSP